MSLEMLGISKGLLTLAIINLSIILVLIPMGKIYLLILKLLEVVLEEVRKIRQKN